MLEWSDKSDGFPCRVKYYGKDEELWMDIKFQANPVKEVGKNGMCMLDVLDSMIKRLNDFDSKWPCKENAMAISYMEEAKRWLKTKRERRIQERVNA